MKLPTYLGPLVKVLLWLSIVVAQPNASAGDYLYPSWQLNMGQSITSSAGKYRLVMQSDGNLVMYRADGTVRWSRPGAGWYAVMQNDGNFVEYNVMLSPIWHTGTYGHPGALLHIQDDGNLVVYSSTWAPLWNIGAEPDPNDPTLAGDVVGRDLAYPIGSFLGHVGLFDGNGSVIQATKDAAKVVEVVPFSTFKTKTTHFWGKASANIPAGITNMGCYRVICRSYLDNEQFEIREAAVREAYVAAQIGAVYTITADWQPYYHGDGVHAPVMGVYRCDTFVLFMLGDQARTYQTLTTARKNWINFIVNFAYHDDKTPALVFSRLSNYK